MTKTELVSAIRVNLFADKPTVALAFEYFHDMILSLSPADKQAATIGMHVLLNTVANEIDKLAVDDQLSVLLDARINAIVDSRFANLGFDDQIAEWFHDNFDLDYAVQQAIEDHDFDRTVEEVINGLDLVVRVR